MGNELKFKSNVNITGTLSTDAGLKLPQYTTENLPLDVLDGTLALDTTRNELVYFIETDTPPRWERFGFETTATHVIYVSKDGNDTNDGFSSDKAKLTITAAVAEAETLKTNGATGVKVEVLDAGEYDIYTGEGTTDLVIGENVQIFAPSATFIAATSLGKNSSIILDKHYAPADSTQPVNLQSVTGGGRAFYKANLIDARGKDGLRTNVTAVRVSTGAEINIFVEVNEIIVGDLAGLVDNSTNALGGITAFVNKIIIGATAGRAVQSVSGTNGRINLTVNSITEIDGGVTNARGIRLNSIGGIFNINAGEILCGGSGGQVYNMVEGNGDLYLNCPHLVGDKTGTPAAEISNDTLAAKTKITNIDIDSDGITTDYILAADGGGAVTWVENTGGHIIQDTGVDQTQRRNLNFIGGGVSVTDDSPNDATIIDVTGVATTLLDLDRIYVSKNGNDVNTGLNINEPKLTIASAITAAQGLQTTNEPPIAIEVLDGGFYTESVTLTKNLHLLAPYATLEGKVELNPDTSVVLYKHYTVDGGGKAVEVEGTGDGNIFYQTQIADARGKNGTITDQAFLSWTLFADYGNASVHVKIGDAYSALGNSVNGGDSIFFLYDDGTGGGDEKLFLEIDNVYLTANDATFLYTNKKGIEAYAKVGRIIETGDFTNTRAVWFGSTTESENYISLDAGKIDCKVLYDSDSANSNLFLRCPDIKDGIVEDGTLATFNEISNRTASGGGSISDQTHVVYVSKTGLNSNSGKNLGAPKDTITNAITVADGLITSNGGGSVTVVVIDSGEYAEDIVLSDNVNLLAPNANLNGLLQIGENCSVELNRHIFPTGAAASSILVEKNSTGESYYKANVIDTITNAPSAVHYAIRNSTVDDQLFHVRVGRIELSESGVGIENQRNSSNFYCDVDSIRLEGSNTTGIASNTSSPLISSYTYANVRNISCDGLSSPVYTNQKAIDMRGDNGQNLNIIVDGTLYADYAYEITDGVGDPTSGNLTLKCPGIISASGVAGARVGYPFREETNVSTPSLTGTTTDEIQTEIFIDGNSGENFRVTLQDDTTATFSALVTGRSATDSAGYKIEGVVKNVAGTTTLVGTAIKTVFAEDSNVWDATIAVDDATNSIQFLVTGEASTTIDWRADVQLTQIVN